LPISGVQPVLRTLRIDLDQRRLFLRVVLADGLDGPAVAAGARVRDDDAVLRVADLAETGELDLDSHCCVLLRGAPRRVSRAIRTTRPSGTPGFASSL